jgi:ABC-type multidrug transport system fused ATPase/permease subunit
MPMQTLLAFMLYQGQLLEYFNNLINSFTNLIKSAGAGAKVFELLARSPIDIQGREAQLLSGAVGKTVSDPKGRLEFDGVSFAYPTRSDTPVLRGVSFAAPPGQVTAVVGSSGAGKSTLFHLVQHFYEPNSGTMRFDGVDVSTLDHKWLHRVVALVGQGKHTRKQQLLEMC